MLSLIYGTGYNQKIRRCSKAELFARIDEMFEESSYVMKVTPEDLIREDRDSR